MKIDWIRWRHYRSQLGLTQAETAKAVGLSLYKYQKAENDSRRAYFGDVEKIEGFFQREFKKEDK